MFAAGASAQSGGVLLPISITNASGNIADMTKAADGNPNTIWNSGAGPKQWIDIDLGSERMFSILRMLPSQNPPGNTIHHVWGRNDAGEWFDFGEVSGYTQDNKWIEFNNLKEIPVRTIILQTTSSPSWVAWRDFQVFDGGTLSEVCFANQIPLNWIVYATGKSDSCSNSDKTIYSIRDLSNQRKGTRALACSHYRLSNWKIVDIGRANGRCSEYQFDEIDLLERN